MMINLHPPLRVILAGLPPTWALTTRVSDSAFDTTTDLLQRRVGGKNGEEPKGGYVLQR